MLLKNQQKKMKQLLMLTGNNLFQFQFQTKLETAKPKEQT